MGFEMEERESFKKAGQILGRFTLAKKLDPSAEREFSLPGVSAAVAKRGRRADKKITSKEQIPARIRDGFDHLKHFVMAARLEGLQASVIDAFTYVEECEERGRHPDVAEFIRGLEKSQKR